MTTAISTRQVEPDITVVEISGRLNLGNNLAQAEHTLKQIIESGARKLAVDLAGLTYIDSAGIGMLVGTNGIMDSAGGKVRVSGASGVVAKVFETVHLDRILSLHPDVAASVAAFSGH